MKREKQKQKMLMVVVGNTCMIEISRFSQFQRVSPIFESRLIACFSSPKTLDPSKPAIHYYIDDF